MRKFHMSECPLFLFHCVLISVSATLVMSSPASRASKRSLVHQLSKQLSRAELSEHPDLHINAFPQLELEVREGESVTLECSGVGVPVPVIYWKKDGQRVRQAHGDNEANVLEKLTNLGSKTIESSATVGRLRLECVRPEVAGTYECVADNGFEKVVNRTKVIVLPRSNSHDIYYNEEASLCKTVNDNYQVQIVPHIFLFTEWRFEKKDNNVQLFCRANGVPRPNITWLNEDEEEIEVGEDASILSNGDLFLRNVKQMGQYYCVASNVAGEARIDTFLYVTKPAAN